MHFDANLPCFFVCYAKKIAACFMKKAEICVENRARLTTQPGGGTLEKMEIIFPETEEDVL